jgi:orotidine-5'-phosphate decarboxylase
MFVAGATRPEELRRIRQQIPDHFLLIPGVGAQGGDLAKVSEASLNNDTGILVNASRSIIYAADTVNFATLAAREAAKIQAEMALFIS